jgi:hypothetical protein
MQTRKIAIIAIVRPCFETSRALLGKMAFGRQEGTSTQYKAERSGDSDYIHYNDNTVFLLVNREVSEITVSDMSRYTVDQKVRLLVGAVAATGNEAIIRYEEIPEL